MNIDLSGKTALVSGSTSGIGFAIARGLAQSGADVLVNGRTQTNVDKAVSSLKKAAPNAKVRSVAADVSTAKGCQQLVAAAPAIDILVNNAGIFEPKDFFDIADEDWTTFFEVNVLSGVRLARAWMKGMLQRDWGRIVFISSESGLQIPPEMIHYGVTKTAQLGVSRGLAELTRGTGVTVNSVLPGPTLSEGAQEFVTSLAKQSGQSVETAAASFIKQHRPTSLIQRFATVEEVANMVVYVCSPQASATNGAALRAVARIGLKNQRLLPSNGDLRRLYVGANQASACLGDFLPCPTHRGCFSQRSRLFRPRFPRWRRTAAFPPRRLN